MLQLACTPSAQLLPAGGSPRLLYLLLEVQGGHGAQTLPAQLSFVIDVSDSMRIRLVTQQQFAELLRSGQAQEVLTDGVPAYQVSAAAAQLLGSLPRRIDYARQALEAAVDYLRPQDSFSLVAFAGRAQRMLPATPGGQRRRLLEAALELEHLQLGDGTQLAQGLSLAGQELASTPSNGSAGALRRVLLLTDGHTQNVAECYAWAQQARRAGVRLTTMGIGSEFNEDLLIPLADQTGGSAYYIETPERIPHAFREELGSLLGVAYGSLEAKLQLPQGVALRNVYRVEPELGRFDPGPDLGGSYALLLGDYTPGAPLALLVELVLPPLQPGAYRLAQALLAWDDPDEPLNRRNHRQELIVKVVEQPTVPLDERVMGIVERVGAYKMGTAALEAAHAAGPEQKEAVTLRLRQAATRLLDLGQDGLAGGMFQQADTLEKYGALDPEAEKKLRYQTRRLGRAHEE
ncbi:MAG: vWA domain-containing protein [Chloroflexota bacterium]